MLDRLTSMEVFVRAADLGSFAAAATALGLSPQMVARHIEALEQRLGVRLLNRTTRRQSLTDAGSQFLQSCRRILAETAAAESLADEMQSIPQGKLRISAPLIFGTYSLTPFLSGFLQQFPDLEVDLTLSDRYLDLIEEGYDAAFRIGPLDSLSLVARPLAPYRLLVAASPSYLERSGKPNIPEELTQHSCISYIWWSRNSNAAWTFTHDKKVHTVEIASRLRINDASALLIAALTDQGIIMAPEALLRESLENGRLVRILPDYAPPSRELHLIYSADRQRTAKLRCFIQQAVDAFS
ncbi:LysR-family transcriptional regulatory protein [Yersinia frederiksenii]|nr:LysR-family transcriptional regulatory protein [Yersinia frederiksenii]